MIDPPHYDELGIDGLIPPQMFAGKGCIVVSLKANIMAFDKTGCPAQKVSDGVVKVKTASFWNGNNRLVVESQFGSQLEGYVLLDSGAEVSVFGTNYIPPKAGPEGKI